MLAAAADPDDLAALAEDVSQSACAGTGAPPEPGPAKSLRQPPLTREEQRRSAAIPDFDLPDAEFRAMMCASSAPLADRKKAVVRLLNTFDDADKRPVWTGCLGS
jgi:hypothetical protein